MKEKMLKKLILKIVFIMILVLSNNLLAQASYEQTWKIDSDSRLNLIYPYSEASFANLKDAVGLIPVNIPYSTPDLKGIQLSKLVSFGFDAPVTALDNNVYLKQYNAPSSLPVKAISEDFFNTFGINFASGFPEIKKYALESKNYCLNLAYQAAPSEKVQMPNFMYSKNKDFTDYFIKQIPAYMLFISPTSNKPKKASEDELAKWTSSGLQGFSVDLIAFYKQNFYLLNAVDKESYYFWLPKYQKNKSILITVPKQPAVFENFKALQYPNTESHKYLTSVLLINRTEYVSIDNPPSYAPIFGTDEFNAIYKKGETKTFAVGSLVTLK